MAQETSYRNFERQGSMENAAFERALEHHVSVPEQTSWLEMFCYSEPALNTVEEHLFGSLEGDTLGDFLHRRGNFAPKTLPSGVHLLTGLRLVLQPQATHPETFSPNYISMPQTTYAAMVDAFHLPRIAIETSSVVGPFFWFALDPGHDGENPRLHIIFRKSDVRKVGRTRGWELLLSHELKVGMTTGFLRGTLTADIPRIIGLLKRCGSDIGHSLLLPMIILDNNSSPSKTDGKQREARDWLRLIENAVAMRGEMAADTMSYYAREGMFDINAVNRDLTECHAQVLWKRPAAYLSVIDSIEQAARLFIQTLPEKRDSLDIRRFHTTMSSRLFFYKQKWEGIEVYANTTMQRLEVQRGALYNVIAQKDSRLNLEIAEDQRRLAYTSKRESEAMKGISLLGAVFLPGAFLASIFSTTFFDFQDAPDWASVVSPRFWVYWAVGIPLTLVVVVLYFVWERRRARRHALEEQDIEGGLENMEARIMESLRQRTQGKVGTWEGERKQRRELLAADEENDFGASMRITENLPTITLTAPTLKIEHN